MLSRLSFLKSMLGAGLGFAIPKAAILDTKGLEQPDKHFEKLLYANALATEKDIASFRLEGHAKITFPNGRMRMENLLDEKEGQKSNFVFWCDQDFPADISVTWDFYPVKEPGLCMLFFAAKGKNGKDIFDTSIKKRTGEYGQYHHGDINTFHISYFRRRYESERAFNICNLRKSFGFHMVAQGADPIPSVIDATPPYNIKLVKYQKQISFFINDLPILNFQDDGKTYGPLLSGGKIGFRQMAPLIAEYSNFKVFSLK